MEIKHIYFDGDIIVNKAAFALERRCYEVYLKDIKVYECDYKKQALEIIQAYDNPELTTLKLKKWVEREELLGPIIDNLITRVCKDLKCSEYTIMLGPKDSSNTYRHKAAITAPYKGNRLKENRPLLYTEAKDYILNKYKCLRPDDGEADDLLGIYLTKDPKHAILVSIDKDLWQVPGRHYNLNTREVIKATDPGKLWIDKRKDGTKLDIKGFGFKWFCAQMLLGDSIDNIIKPLKGVGPRKVYNYLKEAETKEQLWSKVLAFYKKYASIEDSATWEERLEENATLLWILRDHDEYYYDWLENNKVNE